jgi:hypothetical protein
MKTEIIQGSQQNGKPEPETAKVYEDPQLSPLKYLKNGNVIEKQAPEGSKTGN